MKWQDYLQCTLVLSILVTACKKLPEKKDYLSQNANFNRKEIYEPVLGRTMLELTQFSADGSTFPMVFSIENARDLRSGKPAAELFQAVKVQEWQRDYTGLEKSLSEIEAKRVWVNAPFLEIRKGSGDFIFRAAPSSLIKTYPDTGYAFDVKIVNKGNERILKDFRLRPLKEIPYEPYEYDTYTRQRKIETRQPASGPVYRVPYTIHPSFLQKMHYTKDSLFTDTLVSVYFNRASETGHTLTFRFLDENRNAINPAMFNNTKWDQLLHGFNRRQTDSTVVYDVAYPIPLTGLKTAYAASGKAFCTFGYSRKGYGGVREDASFGLNFAIYEPGDWSITFYFRRNPIFNDD
ncbi:DUF5007 domain-containing protein [Chitinophaga arvensicola]|uniref:DUF5007 domain-containing protein n=1 Tax=Chitinophaga arvensicola TaxID=29529 RepID=A0A1I0R820_9BACT|nr:DUF5007 domain-containing protein [Chitinophaga arvensicola]SEW36656.1 protein of unknown function [Chitinophaga arvensicola]